MVRSIVSKLQNEVTEIDVYQLGAIKGKKIETSTSALGGTAVAEQNSLISSTSLTINIVDFLKSVKTIPLANEVFSEDVAIKIGVTRSKGSLSEDLRYALPDTRDSVGIEPMQTYQPKLKDKMFTSATAFQIDFIDEYAGVIKYLKRGGVKNVDAIIQAARYGLFPSD